MERVLFSEKQGSGVICSNAEEIYSIAQKQPIKINGQIYKPGDKTNLNRFFCRDLEYIGRINNEAFFCMGCQKDIFNEVWYYQSLYVITDTRIFLMYDPKSGRDYNFIKGHWK